MNFDLTPREVPVTIGKEQYLLVEATEDVACKFRNASLNNMKVDDGKIVGMSGVADVEPLLVSMCLLKNVGNSMVPVDISTVRAWPSRIVKKLFETIKEISELGEGGENAKKSPSGGADNSDTPLG